MNFIFNIVFYILYFTFYIYKKMPANKRPRRVNYAVNKKWPKSGGKVAKAVSHYKKLQTRIGFEGETKWLSNAMKIVLIKLKKYSINLNKI